MAFVDQDYTIDCVNQSDDVTKETEDFFIYLDRHPFFYSPLPEENIIENNQHPHAENASKAEEPTARHGRFQLLNLENYLTDIQGIAPQHSKYNSNNFQSEKAMYLMETINRMSLPQDNSIKVSRCHCLPPKLHSHKRLAKMVRPYAV
jgi:hypothetical protein